jgi:uncharacterized protein (DUF58 family)
MRVFKRFFRDIQRMPRQLMRRRRGRRITVEGVIFIALTFLIGLAAYNTGTNPLYLILAMMLSFLIVSGVLSSISLRKIEVDRVVPHHITAQEEFIVHLTMTNRKRLFPSYSLRIVDCLKTGEAVGVCFILKVPRNTRFKCSYTCRFPRRGVYTLHRLSVSTQFPFGFFERSVATIVPRDVIVYPEIVDIKRYIHQSQIDFGEYDAMKKGLGTSLYGLREYVSGDSARFIHWKVSAKSRKLMVREFEKEEKKKVCIFLNNVSSTFGDSVTAESFEKAIILVASMAKFLIDDDYQVQLVTASGKVPYDTGVTHLYRILRALAVLELLPLERKMMLGLPDADSASLFVYFDPAGFDERYAFSAQIIDATKWKRPQADDRE